MDSDGDGVPDDQEELPFEHCDDDGLPNYLDPDSDDDGIGDLLDQCDCAPYPNDPSGCPPEITDKKVWWLHGYKGSEYSFIKVGDHVNSKYKIDSKYPSYTASDESLDASALNVTRDIKADVSGLSNTNKNFIMAHSLGGLVTRKMGMLVNEFNNVPLYNGLITFGTPHSGAGAADIIVDKPYILENAVDAACLALTAGPLSEAVEANIGLQLIALFGKLDNLQDIACDIASSPALDNIVKPFALIGVEQDLTTRNNSVIPPMPTSHNAVFYGIEDDAEDDLFPRFLGAINNNSNDYDLFQAGQSDLDGMAEFASYLDHYSNKMERYSNSPFDFIKYHSYKIGVDYINNANSVWKELIAALTTEMVSETSLQCVCVVPSGTSLIEKYRHDITTESECDDFQDMINSDPLSNENVLCRVETAQNITFQHFNKPSDGFILAESAKNGPGINYELQFMPGSNHLQLKNDENMRQAIKAIFENGLNPLNPNAYFKTEER